MIGVRHIVLAVNKMDLVGYEQSRFDAICAEFRDFAAGIGIDEFTAIPISGLAGDNITALSKNTVWYQGPTLIAHLEAVQSMVSRPNAPLPYAGAVGQPAQP